MGDLHSKGWVPDKQGNGVLDVPLVAPEYNLSVEQEPANVCEYPADEYDAPYVPECERAEAFLQKFGGKQDEGRRYGHMGSVTFKGDCCSDLLFCFLTEV